MRREFWPEFLADFVTRAVDAKNLISTYPENVIRALVDMTFLKEGLSRLDAIIENKDNIITLKLCIGDMEKDFNVKKANDRLYSKRLIDALKRDIESYELSVKWIRSSEPEEIINDIAGRDVIEVIFEELQSIGVDISEYRRQVDVVDEKLKESFLSGVVAMDVLQSDSALVPRRFWWRFLDLESGKKGGKRK